MLIRSSHNYMIYIYLLRDEPSIGPLHELIIKWKVDDKIRNITNFHALYV